MIRKIKRKLIETAKEYALAVLALFIIVFGEEKPNGKERRL